MAATMLTINPELVVALKRLRLGRIADTLPERLVLAEKQDMSLGDLLLLVLSHEISRRDSAAADVRARDAGLNSAMRLELWDKTSKVTFSKRVLAELTSLRFLETHRHVVVLGPVGVGKTFISQALGHLACQHGYPSSAKCDSMLATRTSLAARSSTAGKCRMASGSAFRCAHGSRSESRHRRRRSRGVR